MSRVFWLALILSHSTLFGQSKDSTSLDSLKRKYFNRSISSGILNALIVSSVIVPIILITTESETPERNIAASAGFAIGLYPAIKLSKASGERIRRKLGITKETAIAWEREKYYNRWWRRKSRKKRDPADD